MLGYGHPQAAAFQLRNTFASQHMTPPSALNVAPVVKLASSLSAKHIVLAMSSEVPSLCRGRAL
jgi:hypothetical protein